MRRKNTADAVFFHCRMEDFMRLPEHFLIGAATAAHQVEGNNIRSDLWAMEHMKHTSFLEPSLDAVDHYHRYEEDIKLLSDAGLNAYRFSIEWARIEPEEGVFDAGASHITTTSSPAAKNTVWNRLLPCIIFPARNG